MKKEDRFMQRRGAMKIFSKKNTIKEKENLNSKENRSMRLEKKWLGLRESNKIR